MKKKGHNLFPGKVEKIHMPNNSGVPFILSAIFFIWGFSVIFSLWIPVIISTIGIVVCLFHRSFEKDHGRYISVDEIKKTETNLRGVI